jgi:PhoPQ-activated pathogenicity-related protein
VYKISWIEELLVKEKWFSNSTEARDFRRDLAARNKASVLTRDKRQQERERKEKHK